MKTQGLIYLASPYTDKDPGVRERRFEAVTKAAGILMADGEYVFSPITHGHEIAKRCKLPTDWSYWRGYCVVMISCCSLLCVLCIDGWKESVGVQAEIEIAKELGIPVRYVDENLNVIGEPQ
jgi:hypothetical protein